MTVIPTEDGSLGTVTNGLKRKLDQLEIKRRIENTALLRPAGILRRVLET